MGIQVFVIAEASTGYVSNFYTYEGDNLQEKRSTAEIALSLLGIFKNESFYVFMDSYYTSIPFFEALLTMAYMQLELSEKLGSIFLSNSRMRLTKCLKAKQDFGGKKDCF